MGKELDYFLFWGDFRTKTQPFEEVGQKSFSSRGKRSRTPIKIIFFTTGTPGATSTNKVRKAKRKLKFIPSHNEESSTKNILNLTICTLCY